MNFPTLASPQSYAISQNPCGICTNTIKNEYVRILLGYTFVGIYIVGTNFFKAFIICSEIKQANCDSIQLKKRTKEICIANPPIGLRKNVAYFQSKTSQKVEVRMQRSVLHSISFKLSTFVTETTLDVANVVLGVCFCFIQHGRTTHRNLCP